MRVLVVEDEAKMADLIKRGLEHEGYAVDLAGDGGEALWAAREFDFDAIVLDAMIPEPDGFEVCRTLRSEGRWTPVLLLTARDAVDDRVQGLDAGADDYLTKPFAFTELFARLRALTRRDLGARPTVLEVGDLVLDPATHQVRPGEVLSRADLLEHVWDFAYEGTSNLVDVYVRTLRERIDRPFGVDSIETVRGAGYRLRTEVRDAPGETS